MRNVYLRCLYRELLVETTQNLNILYMNGPNFQLKSPSPKIEQVRLLININNEKLSKSHDFSYTTYIKYGDHNHQFELSIYTLHIEIQGRIHKQLPTKASQIHFFLICMYVHMYLYIYIFMCVCLQGMCLKTQIIITWFFRCNIYESLPLMLQPMHSS